MENKIKDWLSRTGYPLELYVHKIAQSKGYLCEKSPMYSDIESGIAREIDLTAYHHGIGTDEYSYDIQLLFECKKSEKPLITLCENNSYGERYEHFLGRTTDSMLAGALGYCHLHTNLTPEQRREQIGRFSERTHAGYSIVPAFSTSDENIYKGIMALASAHEHYRREHHEIFESARNYLAAHRSDRYLFQLLVPVLVVDATLYNVYLTDSGDVNLDETDWTSISVRLPWVVGTYDQMRRCNIQVIRKDALADFIDAAQQLHACISQPEVVSQAVTHLEDHLTLGQKGRALLHRLTGRT